MASKPLEFEWVVVRSLNDDELLVHPMVETLDNESDRLLAALNERVPILTGALASSQNRELTTEGLIVSYGEPYGSILNASANTHYRQGQFTGEPTQNWFNDSVGQFAASIANPWFKVIEAVWNGR